MKILFYLLLILPLTSRSQNEVTKKDNIIQISPEYPGGTSAMEKYISENFLYPKSARVNGEQGTIWVEFIVHSDGIIRNIRITGSVSPTLDAEAIRVMELMPKWKPGEQNGQKVDVRYTIPIKAKLEYSNKKGKRIKRKSLKHSLKQQIRK